jgi:light-regulated signal transduction histidine kinase (bacteriophytochrome)
MQETPSAVVTLDNCDQEPIHIPGLLQPHGALFAFDLQGLTTHASVNAASLLGVAIPALGERVASSHFGSDAGVHALLESAREDAQGDPQTAEVRLGERLFDVISHRMGDSVIA